MQDNTYLAGLVMTINWGPKVLLSHGTMTNDWNLLEFRTLLFSQNSSEHLKIEKGRLKFLIPFSTRNASTI